MIQRLQMTDEKDNPDPRGDLDRWLETGLWRALGVQARYQEVEREPGAPDWWHGDEEASQSFFRSMDIDPTRWGER